MRYRVYSLGFRDQGLGFRVTDLWFMVHGSEFKVRVYASRYRN